MYIRDCHASCLSRLGDDSRLACDPYCHDQESLQFGPRCTIESTHYLRRVCHPHPVLPSFFLCLQIFLMLRKNSLALASIECLKPCTFLKCILYMVRPRICFVFLVRILLPLPISPIFRRVPLYRVKRKLIKLLAEFSSWQWPFSPAIPSYRSFG